MWTELSGNRRTTVLWADANRIGEGMEGRRFRRSFDAAPRQVRGFAPYAAQLVGIAVSHDSSPQMLSWADRVLTRLALAARNYPEVTVERARVAYRLGDVTRARSLLHRVEWASQSANYLSAAAEIGPGE